MTLGKVNDAKVNFVIPAELKAEAQKKAQELGMSLSAYVRYVLVKSIEK